MSVLWAGGEDHQFKITNNPTVITTSGQFRSGYARCVLCGNDYCTGSPFPGGSITDCWFSFRVYIGHYSGYESGAIMAGLTYTGKNGDGLYLALSGTTSLRLVTRAGATVTTLATEASASFTASDIYKIDVCLTSFNSASANVKVYVNGGSSARIDYTGDVRVSSMTALDSVAFKGYSYFASVTMSEFIVADEDTRTMSVVTNYLNAAGDTNDWTGAYTDIDETTLNDADLIYTNTDAKDFQANLSATPSGTFGVKAVLVSARAVKSSDASVGTLKLGIKSGSTVDVDAGHALATALENHERIMTVNPVTSSDFTIAEVDALQVDFRSST